MKIRLKFEKHGSMKFIGHLDIMRYFQKAMRRANIDIAYSGGYSPHQIMSFAAPLGVGLESNGEYMDIEVHTLTSSKELLEKLNQAMAEGIKVLSAKLLPETVGNAMASVAAARYTIAFREGYVPDFDWKSQMESCYSQSQILVTKQTKKSTKELDLKPFIYELKAVGDKIEMLVDASSSGNIKPTLVMEAVYHSSGVEELPEFALLITREETYANSGTAENPCFVPLEALGDDF